MEVYVLLILTCVLVVLWPLLLRLWRGWRELRVMYAAVKQLPGPKPHWLFGNLYKHPGSSELMLQQWEERVREFKTAYSFWTGPIRGAVVLCHPDTLRNVVSSLEHTEKSMATYHYIKPWIGEGLIVSSGPKWYRNRRLLTPGFHFGVLKPYVQIYNDAADKMMATWREKSEGGKSVEIYQDVSRCTLQVVLKCAFSYEGDVQSGHGKQESYVNAVHGLSKMVVTRYRNLWLRLDFIFRRSKAGEEFSKLLNLVHSVGDEVIESRRKILENKQTTSDKKYLDFLDILLSAKDTDGQGLTNEEIRDEVDTFMFAGHDTTASATSWTIYSLACHPEYQEKARQEVRAVLEGKEENNDNIEWDDVSKLEYVTMCIKETMRRHTTVPSIQRKASKPLVVNDVTLPAGTTLFLNLYSLHNNPHVWGDDYSQYKPQRHAPESRKNRDPYAFMPFSAGPRNCIGQNFALNEMRVIIAKLLTRFTFTLDPNHEVERAPQIVMRAKNGIRIIFTPL